MIIVSSFVGWYSGLLNSVSRKESFNLSQQGLNDKYVIPPSITSPTTNAKLYESIKAVKIYVEFYSFLYIIKVTETI